MKTYRKTINIAVIFLTILAGFAHVNAQTAAMKKFKTAQAYESSGEFQNASEIYLELFEYNPKINDFFDGVVRCYKSLSKYDDLIPVIEEKINVYPEVSDYAIYGETLWRLGENEKAREAWAAGIELNPRMRETYRLIARSQIELRLFDKAISTFKQARRTFNNDELFSDELSQLYVAVGDVKSGVDEILRLFETTNSIPTAQGRLTALMTTDQAAEYIGEKIAAKASNRSNINYRRLYAWFLSATDRPEEALDVYISIDKSINGAGREVVEFAGNAARENNFDVAARAYEYVIAMGKSSPHAVSALYGYASTLEKKFETENTLSEDAAKRIIDHYEKIVKDFRRTNYAADAKLRIARIYMDHLHDEKRAVKELEELVKEFNNPKTVAEALLELGRINALKENFDKAVEFYSEVKKRFYRQYPDMANEADYRTAELLYYQGYIDSAAAIFAECAALSNSDAANDAIERSAIIQAAKDIPEAIKKFAGAEFYEEKREFAKALELYEEVGKIAPFSDLAERSVVRRAKIEMGRNAYETSREILKSALEANPQSIYADYFLVLIGDSHFDQGEYSKAEDYYKECLAEYPKSIRLEYARERIRYIRSNYLN